MINLQKMGGIAALFNAAAYVIGFAVYFIVIDYSQYSGPLRVVELLIDHQAALYVSNIIIYVMFGIFLIILTLAIHEQLKRHSLHIMQTATALGLIWAGLMISSGMIFNIGMEQVITLFDRDPAQAITVWSTVNIIQEALGGGIELVGGLWVLLLSAVASKASDFSKTLNYLGLLIGLAGVLTLIPGLDIMTMIFGLGQIVWFLWLGGVLLSDNSYTEKAC